jgi:hypothetical protein
MSPRRTPNLAASVRQRLLVLSRERQEDFQVVLARYAIERLLYRLGCSQYAGQCILKGAQLFSLWGGEPHRPTRDLDLLGSGENTVERFEQVFRDLCQVSVEPDGLEWLAETVKGIQLREADEYEGLRIELVARLGEARIPVQVDLGFGDAVTPEPLEVEFPTLLPFPAPRLRAYPRETVVAEKFWIMARLGMANSRMKDFYDIWTLAWRFPFEGQVLAQAIEATFARRKTPLPSEPPVALTPDFGLDPAKQTQWLAFLRKGRLPADDTSLDALTSLLHDFLMPPTLTLLAAATFAAFWPAGGPWQVAEGEKI